MKLKFLADADLNKAILTGVLRREPAIDFLSAQAAGLRGMPDTEVLALAATMQRILASLNVGTMLLHSPALSQFPSIRRPKLWRCSPPPKSRYRNGN